MVELPDPKQQDDLVYQEISQSSLTKSQMEGLSRLARRCLAEFRTHSELVEEKLFPLERGPNESLVICTRGGGVIAAASFDIHIAGERRIGGIRTILIDPIFRRRGVGTRLIHAVETSLDHRGVERIWLYCSVPNYLYPGAPANDLSIASFAGKLGYRTGVPTRDMGVDLLRLKEQPAPEGICIRALGLNAADPRLEDFRRFARREFPMFVAEIEAALKRSAPIAHLAYIQGAIVGFCVACSFNAPLGAVGPAAVLPSHRGGTVFRHLVSACLVSLRERGHGFARMQWADSRATGFYKRWFDGFVSDEYIIYVKDNAMRELDRGSPDAAPGTRRHA